jgi:hypothetical protein
MHGTGFWTKRLEAPHSKQIVQDVTKVIDTMKKIKNNGGRAIQGVGDRVGKRHVCCGNGGGERGGGKQRRKTAALKSQWLNTDCQGAKGVKIERAIERDEKAH